MPSASREGEGPGDFDALSAAPGQHRVLLENEQVRVLDTRLAPGEQTPLHAHAWPGVLYVRSWSDFVRRDADGQVLVDSRAMAAKPAAGSALWSPALGLHSAENVGDGDLHVLAVEVKGGRPSAAPLAAWHALVGARDVSGLDALLADDVVFHSPVVHTPQRGKALALQYLEAAVRVFGNESFRYVRELAGERDAVLEFEVEIEGLHVNGVDLLRWDDTGRIVDFKVFIRPLKAVLGIQQRMAAILQAKS